MGSLASHSTHAEAVFFYYSHHVCRLYSKCKIFIYFGKIYHNLVETLSHEMVSVSFVRILVLHYISGKVDNSRCRTRTYIAHQSSAYTV